MIGALRRGAARVVLPFDTRERHEVVARLAGAPETLLDAGGRPGELEAFLRGTRVTTLNVDPPADVVSAGIELPFPDGSFDAATSLDVLEHLASQDRPRHLAELVRVARDTVVACTPLGSPGHVEAERELADWYAATTGSRHRFLDEHLEHGLPEEEELRALAQELGLELRFHGDFRRTNELFRAQVLARRLRPGGLAASAEAVASRVSLELSTHPTPFTNRAFLIGAT